MSAKTKIVVLHMKELIYTGIFVALGILLIALLAMTFLPKKEKPTDTDITDVSSEAIYIPGIYTTELILGGQIVDIEVIVESDSISSIRIVNLSNDITAMYPLLQPTFDSISAQIYESQSLENITYPNDSKYTSLVLLEAINSSLNKAKPSVSPSASPLPTSLRTPAPSSSDVSIGKSGS